MFRTVSGVQVDPVIYIKEYKMTHRDLKIFVGCDSQNYGKTTVYTTAIVLYTPGHGGHIIYEKEKCAREKVGAIRLMNEVWKSIELANHMCDQGIQKPDFIDIDINPKQNCKSNEVFNAAVGIVESCCYKCRYKTLGPVSTWCADFIVRK